MTTASIVQRVWNYCNTDLPRLLSRGLRKETQTILALAEVK